MIEPLPQADPSNPGDGSGDAVAREAVAAFALACNYLKDRIDVPKFRRAAGERPPDVTDSESIATVRLLPRPPSLLRLQRSLDVAGEAPCFAERLATVFCYSVAPLRWEPRNISSLHAAIPRPGGGAFCSRLYLSLPDGTGRRAHYRYEPNAHALFQVGASPSSDPRAEISVSADIGRIVDGYGDFSLTLASIEGGHCAAQILMLLQMLSVPATWSEAAAEGLVLDGRGQVTIGSFRCGEEDAADAIAGLPQAESVIFSPRPADDYASRFPAMTGAAAIVERTRPPPARRSIAAPAEAASAERVAAFLRASARRSSGLEGEGFAPRRALDAERLRRLLDEWRELAAPLPLATSHPVRTFVAVIGADGVPPAFSEIELASGRLRSRIEGQTAQIFKRNVGLGAGYNLEEFSLAVVMSLPLIKRVREQGPAAYARALSEAGAIGQAFTVAAASAGMFARPFRAYEEAALEQQLGIEDQIVYLILAGTERIVNPSLALLP